MTTATGNGWSLTHGRWQDVLASTVCDALITDAPYGARTHAAESTRADDVDVAGLTPTYAAWTPADVDEFVSSWSPRVTGWMASMTSHDLIPAWEAAYARVGRYCFAPVTALISGMSVRIQGDGPSSWTIYVVVARPRTKHAMNWGTLPGGYSGPRRAGAGGGRGKPDWLCNALVRDYSRPGDRVVDPMAGWATTLEAAVGNGRTAIGAEMDRAAYTEGVRRLRRGIQADMFGGAT